MKKILLLTLLLLLNISPILAQEEEGIVSSNAYFDLRLTRGVQSPINKSIPFTVYITPKIDSPRTQILGMCLRSLTLKLNILSLLT